MATAAVEDESALVCAPPKATGPKVIEPPRGGPRENEPDLPLLEFSHRFESDPEACRDLVAAWQRLAEVAIEPNAFYEPWFLLPAWRNLTKRDTPRERVELLVIEAPKRVYPEGPKVLCGLFPIVRRRSFHGLPVGCWELWRHDYNFLGTPLVRRDCAREVLDHFFHLAATSTCGAVVVDLPTTTGDGPWSRLLIESNHAHRRGVFSRDVQTRAIFRRAADAESFLKACLARKKRQGILRQERRLAELGTLATNWLSDAAQAEAWAEAFLQLEARGWKGANGTAMLSDPGHAAFFREMIAEAAQANRLLAGRLDFNGQPIAMICNLLSPAGADNTTGGFSFKIAYDEAFSHHSPGLLLELALIRELHDRGIDWMDSCAVSDHSMINALWPDRTVRQSLVVSTGARGGELAVALLPLARWGTNLLRWFRKRPSQASRCMETSSTTENSPG